MDGERQFAMSVPLDGDGFLRRECPSCGCQFKCLVVVDEQAATPPLPGGYYCPYCGLQASADEWWTSEQIDHATALLTGEVIAPELRKLERELKRSSGGFVQVSSEVSLPDPPVGEMIESNDMKRVDFACHPEDPVKVLDGWNRGVRCRICGSVAEP